MRSDWIRVGLALADDAVVSGWDAVRAYGIGPSRPVHEHVLVLTRSGRSNRTVGRVHFRPSRRVLSTQWRQYDGGMWAPTADVARAVADTALELHTLAPARALVTSAAQRGLCRPEDLRIAYLDGPRNDSAILRLALADLAAGAASLPEAELADLLRAAALPPFELNVRVLNAAGRHVATIDVLWRSLRAGLEVDSRAHHFLEPDWRATMRRHNALAAAGLVLTHYPPTDIRDRPQQVLAEIDTWLRARAHEVGVGYPTPVPPDAGRPLCLRAL